MTKKLFRTANIIFAFVLGGVFLNSCSNVNLQNYEEITAVNEVEDSPVKIAEVSFSVSGSDSDTTARTALPDPDEHDLKKFLYLYNYTLSYVDENGEELAGEEKIICNDFSYDKFLEESTIRLATGKKYKFTLKAKDGAVTRMEGSSIVTLSDKPFQKVTIVLVPAGDEYGQKLRIDWIVPDDGVIKTMKAGISPERGHAENQTEDEILVPKYRFQEYAFSVIKNPFADDDPRKEEYGSTVKRIGLTFDDVKTGVSRWLDYKFYDENGILVYESSESVYMIGGKTSKTVIYISPDHYYRRPVIIPINKDNEPWTDNPDLKLKLVDENGNEYVFKPVVKDGKLTGEFEGLLPGASSGLDSTKNTNGIFDIKITLGEDEDSEDGGFIKTGAEYDANKGTIKGNGGEDSTDAVQLVTVPVPQKGVTLTPTEGVLAVDGTPGDKSGNGGLIVPAGQNFTVKVELDLGYKTGDDGKITIGGKEVSDGETVTLNAEDVSGEITVEGIKAIKYSIVYKSNGNTISWKSGYTPTAKFTIESEEIALPEEDDFADGFKDASNRIAGWWFGTGTVENNLDNIIHKINKEKSVKEKLIQSAVNNEVILNVYWIPSEYYEYRIEYKFEELGSDPVNYIEDETVIDVSGKKVLPFHNVVVKNGEPTDVDIPEIPGFTSISKITLPGTADETKEVYFNRNEVTISLDGNGGNWTDGKSTYTETLSGKYGEAHGHVDDPVRENYRFLGWYVKDDPTKTPIKHVDDHKFPATDMDYVAKWEQTHANYRVEYYYENKDSTGYDIDDAKTITPLGMIGAFPAFDTTPKTGFTYNASKREITTGEGGAPVSVVQVDEEGNGITLVKLYFDRKTIEFTLKANGGKFTDGKGNTTEEIILEGKYGTPLPSVDSRGFRVEVPQPPVLDEHALNDGTSVANDFTFKAWHVRTESDLENTLPDPFVFPPENAIYAARWTQHNGLYEVVHWAETLDNKLLAPKAIDGFSGKMLEGSVTKKGQLYNSMVYDIPTVTGFEAQPVEFKYSSGTITADGKAEVIITYLRKKYTINFHLNDSGEKKAHWFGDDPGVVSNQTVGITGKYRTDFTPPHNPSREHFIFAGWTTDKTTNEIVDVVPSFTEDAPKDYYAVWYSKASGGLETDTSDISLVCTENGRVISANVSTPEDSGIWAFSWSINNVAVSNGSNGVTFDSNGKSLKLSGCLAKDYEITVVATHDGKAYTRTEVVTVR
ncbi:MAG: InlB B-repeat-containing protein [Treponema sp.]|nr:InlB B-repeat-containing protein [Treponema sp.]